MGCGHWQGSPGTGPRLRLDALRVWEGTSRDVTRHQDASVTAQDWCGRRAVAGLPALTAFNGALHSSEPPAFSTPILLCTHWQQTLDMAFAHPTPTSEIWRLPDLPVV